MIKNSRNNEDAYKILSIKLEKQKVNFRRYNIKMESKHKKNTFSFDYKGNQHLKSNSRNLNPPKYNYTKYVLTDNQSTKVPLSKAIEYFTYDNEQILNSNAKNQKNKRAKSNFVELLPNINYHMETEDGKNTGYSKGDVDGLKTEYNVSQTVYFKNTYNDKFVNDKKNANSFFQNKEKDVKVNLIKKLMGLEKPKVSLNKYGFFLKKTTDLNQMFRKEEKNYIFYKPTK